MSKLYEFLSRAFKSNQTVRTWGLDNRATLEGGFASAHSSRCYLAELYSFFFPVWASLLPTLHFAWLLSEIKIVIFSLLSLVFKAYFLKQLLKWASLYSYLIIVLVMLIRKRMLLREAANLFFVCLE